MKILKNLFLSFLLSVAFGNVVLSMPNEQPPTIPTTIPQTKIEEEVQNKLFDKATMTETIESLVKEFESIASETQTTPEELSQENQSIMTDIIEHVQTQEQATMTDVDENGIREQLNQIQEQIRNLPQRPKEGNKILQLFKNSRGVLIFFLGYLAVEAYLSDDWRRFMVICGVLGAGNWVFKKIGRNFKNIVMFAAGIAICLTVNYVVYGIHRKF